MKLVIVTENSYWYIYLANPLNTELNPICHLLALLGAHHILHISRIRVNAEIPGLRFTVLVLPVNRYIFLHELCEGSSVVTWNLIPTVEESFTYSSILYNRTYTMGISRISLREYRWAVRTYVGYERMQKTDFSEYSLNPVTYPRRLSMEFICTLNVIGRLQKLLGSNSECFVIIL